MRALILLLLAAPAMSAETWPQPEGKTITNDTGAAIQVQLCRKDMTGCSLSRTMAAGEQLNCGYFNFYSSPGMQMPPDPAYTRICAMMGVATPQPQTGSAFTVCEIKPTADFWNLYETGPSPSPSHPNYVVWVCADNTVQAQVYTDTDAKEFLLAGLKGSAGINAWASQRPVEQLTDAETAFLRDKREAFRVKLGLPAPVASAPKPIPQDLVVQHVTGKTGLDDSRPLYKLKADGTIGSASGKRVTAYTLCNPAKRVGNYAEVPLVGSGLYAICGLVP